MKRELFVFAGQSNMMGAAALPPKHCPKADNSYEYKCKTGLFVTPRHSAGQFVYADDAVAYSPENTDKNGKSTLTDFAKNTYFSPAMCNYDSAKQGAVLPFASFSEANYRSGVSVPPIFAEYWEALGHSCAYMHLAKGGVYIEHYMTSADAESYNLRISNYNRHCGTALKPMAESSVSSGAVEKFCGFTSEFFNACDKRFDEDMTDKIFVWMQGESNAEDSTAEYKIKLEILWENMKKIGFTKFFCIRVGFWGNPKIANVMRAQEEFCEENSDAFTVTREFSRMRGMNVENAAALENGFFADAETEKYANCRDTCYGYANPHYNEKGMTVAAKDFAENADRILYKKLPPDLGSEPVSALRK